jgi:hypothetical protein
MGSRSLLLVSELKEPWVIPDTSKRRFSGWLKLAMIRLMPASATEHASRLAVS